VCRALAAAVVVVVVLAGCGAPEKLSVRDGRRLAMARAHLDDSIDTEEALRTSEAEARRLRRQVNRLVSDGSFEDRKLDEFGLARLGQLREVVPSLVIDDSQGSVHALDRPATADFLRFAERDAARAMLGPARTQVSHMVDTLRGADAGKDTKIPVVGTTAGTYVREAERDVKRIWPALGERLAGAGDDL